MSTTTLGAAEPALAGAARHAPLATSGELSARELTATHVERIVRLTPQLNAFRVAGQPGASIPAGFDADGLPLAVQIAGGADDEATRFELAAQLEQARPWAHHRPTIS